ALASARHEVDDPHCTFGGLEIGLEDKGLGAVAADGGARLARRGEKPATVALIPQQSREARGGVEAGEAEPIDRPVATDEGGGVQITNEAVVFDPQLSSLLVS